MADPAQATHPPDICLLLRAHAEQHWLLSCVIPALRALEHPPVLDPDEIGPAIAYLEVLWLEAGLRAAETDAAAAELDPRDERCSAVLVEKARRYHAAVRRLRHAVDCRVRRLTELGAGLPAGETAV